MSDGSRNFVVVGDGVAGASAAEKIRELSDDVEVTVLTDESEPLYNRIMLKTFMKGSLPKQYCRMHDEDWYEKRDIDLKLNTKVTSVDTDSKVVELDYGGNLEYDYLLIASGGSPRKLDFDEGYSNVRYMWTMSDAERVRESAESAESAVVVGGGLLGIDLAVVYAEHGCEVDYLIRGSCWWSRGLDVEGASLIHERLEDKGVNIVTGVEATGFNVKDGEVRSVECNDGSVRDCDIVGVAIGHTPNSDFVEVGKYSDGLIKTDEYLETSESSVFAAGNMVEYYSPVFEKRVMNGSWDNSEAMGSLAGENMVREKQGEDKVVFDFVNTYGVGHFDVQFLAIGDWDGEPISRKYNDKEYRRLFFDGDRLVGAVLIGFTKGQERIKEMIKEKERFSNRERLLDKDFWS